MGAKYKMNKPLCKWGAKTIEKHLDEVTKIVTDAKYICKKCGRIANDKKYLCKGNSF